MNATNTAKPDTANSTPVPRLALSMQEVADALGVSYQTVYRLVKRGLLRPCGSLRHHLFTPDEVQRYLTATTSK